MLEEEEEDLINDIVTAEFDDVASEKSVTGRISLSLLNQTVIGITFRYCTGIQIYVIYI